MTAASRQFRLEHEFQLLELSARRDGLGTRVELSIDRRLVAEVSGVGRVLAPFPGAHAGCRPLGRRGARRQIIGYDRR